MTYVRKKDNKTQNQTERQFQAEGQ